MLRSSLDQGIDRGAQHLGRPESGSTEVPGTSVIHTLPRDKYHSVWYEGILLYSISHVFRQLRSHAASSAYRLTAPRGNEMATNSPEHLTGFYRWLPEQALQPRDRDC